MTTSLKLINKIQKLKKKGFSLPEITNAVKVPKTTVYRYTRGIDILPEYKESWKIKRGGSRKRKLLKQKMALCEARKLIKSLSDKEKTLFLSALYWAEGSKKDFGLSNTDPELIKVFVNGLSEVLGVKRDRLRISVRLYEDLDRKKCLSFWSNITGVPVENFISVNILPGKKKGKLEYGMCRVRITKGGDILKKIEGINKIVIKNMSL